MSLLKSEVPRGRPLAQHHTEGTRVEQGNFHESPQITLTPMFTELTWNWLRYPGVELQVCEASLNSDMVPCIY